jgi:hypothetical protein
MGPARSCIPRPWGALRLVVAVGLMVCLDAAARTSRTRAQATTSADRNAARELGRKGLRALEQHDAPAAEQLLTGALAHYAAPTLYLARARARRMMLRLTGARDDFAKVATWPHEAGENPAFAKARLDATGELEVVESLIPTLRIVVNGGPATLRVEGVEWQRAWLAKNRPIDPGEYSITATWASGTVWKRTVKVIPSTHRTLVIDIRDAADPEPPASTAEGIAPTPPVAPALAVTEVPPTSPAAQPPPSARHAESSSKRAAYISGGIALALVAVTAVTTAMYYSAHSEFLEHNSWSVPAEKREELRSEAKTVGVIATVAGAAALGTLGLSFYFFATSDSEPQTEDFAAFSGFQMVANGRF